jgi:hypothetical protein
VVNVKKLSDDKKVSFEYSLRYFFQYKFDRDIKINELLDEFCNEYNNHEKIYGVLQELDKFFNFLIDLYYHDKYFKVFDYQILLGQLFYCREEYSEIYDYFKKILISYLLRRNICEYDTKGITALIPTIIPNIIRDYKVLTKLTIKEFFDKKNLTNNAVFPTDAELSESLNSKNFYCKKNISLKTLKFIECLAYRNEKEFDTLPCSTSVEHIYPQKKRCQMRTINK